MEDIIAIVLLFGGGTIAALAYSPIGRAWADRIRGRVAPDPAADASRAELLDAMDGLRREVAELAERVDFTERLLSRGSASAAPGGGDVAR
jgi:hypothetical protein